MATIQEMHNAVRDVFSRLTESEIGGEYVRLKEIAKAYVLRAEAAEIIARAEHTIREARTELADLDKQINQR